MKKVIVSVLLVLTFVLFVGCGGGKGDAGSAGVDASSAGGNAAMDSASADIPADAAESDVSEPETVAYERGIVSETGFESEYLNLRFTAPENFVMATEAELDEMMGLFQDDMDMDALRQAYAELAFTCEMSVSFPQPRMASASVMTEKFAPGNMTEEQYAEAMKEGMPDASFDEVLSTTTLAGQDYTTLRARTELEDITGVQDVLIKKADDRMIVIILTYSDDTVAEKDALIAGFAPY